MHATFLDKFPDASNFVNRCIVNDENRIGKRPLVHTGKYALNKMKEIIARDRVLKYLEVEDPIQADCREYRILCATKEELIPSCTSALY